jgi:hypothetical protein
MPSYTRPNTAGKKGRVKVRNSKWQVANSKSEEKLNLAIYDAHFTTNAAFLAG